MKTVDDIPDDLRWLAENVPSWPVVNGGTVSTSRGSRYTRQEWQTARDLISGKPSWEDAPEWAEWLAQWPDDGEWVFYPSKPSIKTRGYCVDLIEDQIGLNLLSGSKGPILGDWRNTLERRPESTPKPQPTDNVNNPAHYTQGGIECIDAIRAALTADEFRGFCKGNSLKYIWRELHKGGDESLAKARWYIDKVLEGSGHE